MKYPYDEDYEKKAPKKPRSKARRESNQQLRYVLRHSVVNTEDEDDAFDIPLYYHEDHD